MEEEPAYSSGEDHDYMIDIDDDVDVDNDVIISDDQQSVGKSIKIIN